MSSLGYRQDPEFEDRLRTMLQRRAKDVRPNPRPFKELMADADGVVVSLHTGRAMMETPPPRRFQRPWVRPVAAAAACLAITMGAGIAIGRSSNGSGDTGDRADTPTDPAELYATPGDAQFSPATAEVIFSAEGDAERRVAMHDPESAARMYLTSRGIDETAENEFLVWTDLTEQSSAPSDDGRAIEIATVWWSLRPWSAPNDPQPPMVTNGPVYLRNLAGPDEDPAWVVVGAKTMGLLVTDVRRSGETVTFNVTVSHAASTISMASEQQTFVRVNGELVERKLLPLDQQASYTWTVAPDQPVVIQVQQATGPGRALSVTEVAFKPLATVPPADSTIETTAPPATTAATTTTP